MADHECPFSTQVGGMKEAIDTLKTDVGRLREDISRLFQQDEALRVKHMNEYNVVINKIDDLCDNIDKCAQQIQTLISTLNETENDILTHDKTITKLDGMEENLNNLNKNVGDLQELYKKVKLYVQFAVGTASFLTVLWLLLYRSRAIIEFFKSF